MLVSHEPLSHLELDRQWRYLQEEKLKLEWERLQFERQLFTQYFKDNVGACDLLCLSSDQQHHFDDRDTQYRDEKYDKTMIGKRVCRWWEGNKQYFFGTVENVKRDSVFVVYDDGDEAWESSVEDPDDIKHKCCQKTSSCYKLARHTGRCVGAGKRIVDETISQQLQKNTRIRCPPKRLENDNEWGLGCSRDWVSYD